MIFHDIRARAEIFVFEFEAFGFAVTSAHTSNRTHDTHAHMTLQWQHPWRACSHGNSATHHRRTRCTPAAPVGTAGAATRVALQLLRYKSRQAYSGCTCLLVLYSLSAMMRSCHLSQRCIWQLTSTSVDCASRSIVSPRSDSLRAHDQVMRYRDFMTIHALHE